MTPDFDYEHLDTEQRRAIIDGRLQQYEADHFSHRLNRMTLEQAVDISPEEKAQQLAQIDRALASLETSIRLHREQRDELLASG